MFDEKALKNLVGKKFKDAKNIIENLGYKVRHLKPKTVYTLEFRPNRVNLVIDPETNIVTKASIG